MLETGLVVQIISAAAVVFAIGVKRNTEHAEFRDPAGLIETVLLISWVEENMPEFFRQQLYFSPERRTKPEEPSEDRLAHTIWVYQTFKEKGGLTESELLPKSDDDLSVLGDIFLGLIMAVALLVLAPFFCTLLWSDSRERWGTEEIHPVIHPLERTHGSMQAIGLALSILIVGAITTFLLPSSLKFLPAVLLAVPLAVVITTLIFYVRNQTRWKRYWLSVLRSGLQKAAAKNDHDLYNRTLNIYDHVDAQPTIPLTGLQRTVLGVFAVLQILVLPLV